MYIYIRTKEILDENVNKVVDSFIDKTCINVQFNHNKSNNNNQTD